MCDKRNKFCYICGLFVSNKRKIKFETNKSVVEPFNSYFNLSYKSSRWYEPEFICTNCSTSLKKWNANKSQKCCGMAFSVPMIWHHQVYHKPEDCYFCQTSIDGFKFATREHIVYADVLTVTKPIFNEATFKRQKSYKSDDESDVDEPVVDESDHESIKSKNSDDDGHITDVCESSTKIHFVSNADFRDLVRDLDLSWRQTEILGSRLKQWKIVESDFKSTFGRNKTDISFEQYFKSNDEKNFVYCTNIDELFQNLNFEHIPSEWRLFIDGSCKSKFSFKIYMI